MTLSITDLTVARGGLPVLEGVSFDVPPGVALILRGPNGIGKTTLLRTVAGLQPPMKGHVTGGEDQIAYAAHADGIKPTLTVAENLRFWASVFGQDGIERAIDGFNLGALRDRPAGALSAGQKRRLGLARMLVTGRPIWIMDEPTVSLDTDHVRQFAQIVQDHLDQGGSALIATHIDLGLEGKVLNVGPFKAAPPPIDDFDGGFL
ncbi:heme ABC exporter ATP-binding protein CcmA [Epibacterium sp. SM1979]|uniref:Heme ABC exporter ATP-binding protein CcmA n=1 Tax=Tritonibacter litoralis TaxID=2662264 RepID=A0A843Y6W2_9RHOB|nr:heme ABC exporter ATP-binding protein CcmA [Tritonibacter litoralis]MQQ06870.1 heme ABC exporter ATP-binding protein CcmA [Tritonibacter litoralis]